MRVRVAETRMRSAAFSWPSLFFTIFLFRVGFVECRFNIQGAEPKNVYWTEVLKRNESEFEDFNYPTDSGEHSSYSQENEEQVDMATMINDLLELEQQYSFHIQIDDKQYNSVEELLSHGGNEDAIQEAYNKVKHLRSQIRHKASVEDGHEEDGLATVSPEPMQQGSSPAGYCSFTYFMSVIMLLLTVRVK